MAKAKAPSAPSTAPVNRTESNSARRRARNTKRVEDKAANPPKVIRGTARAKRREAARSSGIKGTDFREVWAKFKQVEQGKAAIADLV